MATLPTDRDTSDTAADHVSDHNTLHAVNNILDAKGDVPVATAADTWSRLAVGSNGQVLTADSGETTGLKWAAVSGAYVPLAEIDAKGDLLVGSANDTLNNLAVGTNGYVLTADSAETLGVKWAAAAGTSVAELRLRRAANQSSTNASVAAISWDTEDADTLGMFTPTSSTVTIPTGGGGLWMVTLTAVFQDGNALTASGRNFLDIEKGVSFTILARVPWEIVDTAATTASTLVRLADADTFQCRVFQSSASTKNFKAWLTMARLST